MNCAWLLNQTGIFIEICGACWVALQAYQSGTAAAPLKTDLDSIEHSMQHFINEARRQFRKSLGGFIAVALGLLFQLAANFEMF